MGERAPSPGPSRHAARLLTLLGLTALTAVVAGPRLGTPVFGPRVLAAQLTPTAELVPPGGPLLDEGRAAAREGRLLDADDLFRRAWLDPAARRAAAEELWALHRIPGFSIRADEAAVAALLEELGPGFRRVETPHFVILSDAPPDWVRSRGRLLEATREQYFRVMGKMGLPAIPHRLRLACVLFDQSADFRRFARDRDGVDAEWVAGYYSGAGNRIVFYNQASADAFRDAQDHLGEYERRVAETERRAQDAQAAGRPDRAAELASLAARQQAQVQRMRDDLDTQTRAITDTKTVHEAIHLLAFNTGVQDARRAYPFWLSEGMAMAFETARPDLPFGPDRPGSVIPDRLEQFDQVVDDGRLIPLHRLVRLTEVTRWDEDLAEVMYSQSHALFTAAYKRDPRALGRFIEALDRLPPSAGPQEFADTFADAVGDPAEVERAMLRASQRRRTSRATAEAGHDAGE